VDTAVERTRTTAARCRECGTELITEQTLEEVSSPDAVAEEGLQRIDVLDNAVQAGLLDTILAERGSPHTMKTFHDSAYDGIFQTQKGWGVILAAPRFRDEIMAVLEEIKRESPKQ
jgi:hypothetical protein